jgi:hypothetical protein
MWEAHIQDTFRRSYTFQLACFYGQRQQPRRRKGPLLQNVDTYRGLQNRRKYMLQIVCDKENQSQPLRNRATLEEIHRVGSNSREKIWVSSGDGVLWCGVLVINNIFCFSFFVAEGSNQENKKEWNRDLPHGSSLKTQNPKTIWTINN